MLDPNAFTIDPDAARAFGDQLWTELENTIMPRIAEITGQVADGNGAGLGSSGHGYGGPRFTATHDSSATALTKWLADLQVGIQSLAIGAATTSVLLEDSDFDTAEGVRDAVQVNELVGNYSGDREEGRRE